MRKLLLLLLLFINHIAFAQITTATKKANFGVDGDLRANSFDGNIEANDDWFSNGAPGTGSFVIDTTGAWAIRNGYTTDVAPFRKRNTSFYRTMSVPQFSVINNRIWLDALFVRDYHGTDTTAFISGSDKNGMSPASWTGGVQGVPDKNDILDMFMHVRRAGPNTTDSLWLFGGLSLDNITGNRYFDFELYQTDINYDRTSGRWFGYGPDAGHTSWKFDAAGKVLTPGDIIFSAAYQSSSLSNIEARIWVSKTDWQNVKPEAFNWSGSFDGDGASATFGYAGIMPKTNGAFYTGLQCGANEWAGPFGLVLQNNTVVSDYSGKQFMEFSVNLTKLGLDPVSVFGGDVCGTPFNRMVVKTRTASSFTSELKDFIAPTDLFLASRVMAAAEVPQVCGGTGVSKLKVLNPSGASVYTWTTSDGNLVGKTGTEVYADKAGTYTVTQQLMDGCAAYATATVQVSYDASCITLDEKNMKLNASMRNNYPLLQWSLQVQDKAAVYQLERSTDGNHFEPVYRQSQVTPGTAFFQFYDEGLSLAGQTVFYRVRARLNNVFTHSNMVKVNLPLVTGLRVYPNPATKATAIWITAATKVSGWLQVVNLTGGIVWETSYQLYPGANQLAISQAQFWPSGMYIVRVHVGGKSYQQRLLVGENR